MVAQLQPRILIIDDEPAVGALLRRVFESTGDYLVDVQTDATTAVRRAQLFRPDLIILDVNMPGVSGLEVARIIRAEPWLRHRPIVFFTGMPETKRDCFAAGGVGPTVFVAKGTPMVDLLQTVEQLIAPRFELYRLLRNTSSRESAA